MIRPRTIVELFGATLAVVALWACVAHAGTARMRIAPESWREGSSNPCSASTIGATNIKQTKLCEFHSSNRENVWADVVFPSLASDATNFQIEVTLACASTDTSKRVAFRAKAETTRAGQDWGANVATNATAGSFGTSTAIVGTTLRDLVHTTAVFTPYDTQAAGPCTVGDCGGRHMVVVLERGNDSDVANNVQANCHIVDSHLLYPVP